MLEAYSLNQTVASLDPVVFNNVTVKKGCTATLSGPATIQLNKCGVYMIAFDGSASATTTMQLYKDGVAQPQAQSTDTSLAFTTLVQVAESNSNCPCSSPTTIQVINIDDAEATLTNANIVVTKII